MTWSLTPAMQAAVLMLSTARHVYRNSAGWTDGVTVHRSQTMKALEDRGLVKKDFNGIWLTIEGKRHAEDLKDA